MNMRATTLLLLALLLTLTSCDERSETTNMVAVSDEPVEVATNSLHLCRVTGTRLTDEDCNDAQYWLDQSQRGNASFKAPAKMRQGQTTFVTLALGTAPVAAPAPTPTPSPTLTPAASNDPASNVTTPEATPAGNETAAIRPLPGDRTPHDMAEEGGGTGRTVDYHPFVGQKMKATLEGAGFDVKPLSPEIQTVSEGSNALWRWSVTARDRGDLSLILRTTVVMIDSQGKTQELRPTVEPQPIHVSIGTATLWTWLTGFPDWLKAITAVLVGAAALVAAWKGLRASVLGSKAPPAPPADDKNPAPPAP